MGDIGFYKFPKLRREEIEAMFALDDIRQARVFQEALQEGIQRGIQLGKEEGSRGKAYTIARNLLSLGITIAEIASVTGLSIAEIERLSQ